MAPPTRPKDTPIPHDPLAEAQVAGLALTSRDYARRLGELIRPDEFYDRTLARIFDAARQLADVADPVRRFESIALAVDRPASQLEALADDSYGPPEPWAATVRRVGRRRRLMGLAALAYNEAALADPERLLGLVTDMQAEVSALDWPQCDGQMVARPATGLTIGAHRRGMAS